MGRYLYEHLTQQCDDQTVLLMTYLAVLALPSLLFTDSQQLKVKGLQLSRLKYCGCLILCLDSPDSLHVFIVSFDL